MSEFDPDKERLKLSIETRQLEIELFWKRSLFFWGFIASAFVAYAALLDACISQKEILLTIACFGFICSLAWTLVNRGSKYWQENWEQKVDEYELKVFGEEFFAKQEKIKRQKCCWLEAKKFSVSKLAIALRAQPKIKLSDFSGL
ncbi:MAG: hypothetical protein WD407_05465 [Rhodospirillales bacterium]